MRPTVQLVSLPIPFLGQKLLLDSHGAVVIAVPTILSKSTVQHPVAHRKAVYMLVLLVITWLLLNPRCWYAAFAPRELGYQERALLPLPRLRLVINALSILIIRSWVAIRQAPVEHAALAWSLFVDLKIVPRAKIVHLH